MGAGAARDSWIALGLCCRSGIPVYVVDHRVRLQTPRPKTHQQTHQHRCVDVRKRLYGLALLMTNVGLTFFATFGQPRGEALSNHQLGDSGLGRRPYDFACSAGPPDTGRPLSVLPLSCCSSCGPGVVGWACTLLTYFFFSVDQFNGKWPFRRIFMLQEPASVLFSLLNLVAHAVMLRRYKNCVRSVFPKAIDLLRSLPVCVLFPLRNPPRNTNLKMAGGETAMSLPRRGSQLVIILPPLVSCSPEYQHRRLWQRFGQVFIVAWASAVIFHTRDVKLVLTPPVVLYFGSTLTPRRL